MKCEHNLENNNGVVTTMLLVFNEAIWNGDCLSTTELD